VENETQKKILWDYQTRLELDYDLLGVTILNVGNKSDMLDFVELALAFDLETAVAYEKRNSYYADRRAEEEELNTRLVATMDKGVSVFYTTSNYADTLREEWGEDIFHSYLEKQSEKDISRKFVSFAYDPDIPVPRLIMSIIDWITKSGRS
jgi:hypothetical protein